MGQHRVMCELLGIVCCHVVSHEGGIGCAERSACSLWTEGGCTVVVAKVVYSEMGRAHRPNCCCERRCGATTCKPSVYCIRVCPVDQGVKLQCGVHLEGRPCTLLSLEAMVASEIAAGSRLQVHPQVGHQSSTSSSPKRCKLRHAVTCHWWSSIASMMPINY